MKNIYNIRPLMMTDADLTLKWRSDSETVSSSISRQAPTKAENIAWLTERIFGATTKAFIFEAYRTPVASYTIQLDDQCNISIHYMVAPNRRCEGFAGLMVGEALKLIKERPIFSKARIDNLASRRVLEKNGFELLECSAGFASYRLGCTDQDGDS